MMNRLFVPAVVVFWCLTMIWLVRHDVVPMWTAQDAPRFAPGDWLSESLASSQARIENHYGHRIGTVFSQYVRQGEGLSRQDTAWLQESSFLPPLRIEMESEFTASGALDAFRMTVHGSIPVEMVGERYNNQLGCKVKIGTSAAQLFKIDNADFGMVSDAFRPFPALPKLRVGDSWRMHVVNPVAVIAGIGPRLIPMLVKVTGRAELQTDQGVASCLIVETGSAKAWVDESGAVLRQEVDLPLLGRLTIVAEPFDADMLTRARISVPNSKGLP